MDEIHTIPDLTFARRKNTDFPYQAFSTTIMNSTSQTEGTSIQPITLSNSLRLMLLSNSESSVVLPRMMTNTSSSESNPVERRRRLRLILESAIAILDFDDFNPTLNVSTTHQQPQQ
jgi:hypothetical protein